jgi:hypothetical protein
MGLAAADLELKGPKKTLGHETMYDESTLA